MTTTTIGQPAPAAQAERLTDAMLNDIAGRLTQQLNTDGLRSWYYTDVRNLISEVMVLRREAQQVFTVLATNPALSGLDVPYEALAIAEQLQRVWADHEKGLWAKQRFAAMRDQLREARTEREELSVRLDRAEAQNERLRQEGDTLRAQLLDASRAAGQERNDREHDVAQIAQERDAALRQRDDKHADAVRAIEATRRAYATKALSVRVLLEQAVQQLEPL